MRTGDFLNRSTLLRAALVVALYLAYSLMQASDARDAEEDAGATVCATDSDCLLHCPPPNDDPDCDGGPEQ